MTSLQHSEPRAVELAFHGDLFELRLEDGRILSVPLEWFPRLEHASLAQRKNFEWLGKGLAMHGPDIDEDISVDGLLRGVKAPRSKAYLEGPSEESRRRRAEIEAEYKTKRAPIRTPRKKVSKAKH